MCDGDCVSDYARSMGKVIVNLQSLEFPLRAFLYGHTTRWRSGTEPDFLDSIAKGETVRENTFTNYDSLRQLVTKYNSIVRAKDSSLQVDEEVIRVRDALAHGRIACASRSSTEPKLVKYGKPKNGCVNVTDCYLLTNAWLKEKIGLAYESINKVEQAIKLFKGNDNV